MIDETVAALNQKKLILYPTDTVWGIGGDATDYEVVEKIYRLKQRADHKALIVLVNSLEMLQEYVESIPKKAYSFLNSKRPTTIIYPKGIGFAKNLLGTDFSIGIRVSAYAFNQEVISRFGKPIVSTSANISGAPTPSSFDAIAPEVLEGVDYIVPLTTNTDIQNNQPSQVVRIGTKDQIQILRQ